ncbi:hypothetical protein BsWGS_17186 [Bradybaena similaris]
MSDDEGQYEASIDEHLETNVVLPDGTTKENYKILLPNKVGKEKERIWNYENQQGPPGLHQFVLVILGQNGEQKVMNDDARIEDYLDDLTVGTIKFMLPSDVGGQ